MFIDDSLLSADASPINNHKKSTGSVAVIERLDQQKQLDLIDEEATTKPTLRQRSPSLSNMAAADQGHDQGAITSFDVITSMSSNRQKSLTTMVLAHEVILNGNFKLTPLEPEEDSLEKQTQDRKLDAFWEGFRSQMDTHIIVVVAQVKETLLSLLLPQHGKLRTQIQEVLDLDLIRQQAQHQALDVIKLATYVIDIMSKLCAPAREGDIANLALLSDPVDICRGILRVLNLMNIDVANLALQSIQPHLQHQSVEYQRKKFEEFLETQQDGLQHTRQWLEKASQKLLAKMKRPERKPQLQHAPGFEDLSSSASHEQNIAVSLAAILKNGYIDLLSRDAKDAANFPETVLMDQGRIFEMGVQVNKLILVGSILLVTYTNTGTMLSGIQGFPSKLKHNLFILLEGVTDHSRVTDSLSGQVCKEVAECLAEHGFPVWDVNRTEAFKSQIRALTVNDSHILSIVDSRVRGFLLKAISAPSGYDLSANIPPGLGIMQNHLLEVTRAFVRLVVHNRSVFGPFYADILSNIVKWT